MLRTSIFTEPFGLTEPLFVPEYWSPPSLFNLALTTGFDIESLIFCFGIGGVAAVLYNIFRGHVVYPLPMEERSRRIHRYHYAAILSPVFVFVPLAFIDWNPIYPGIIAMAVGSVATASCRHDLISKSWIGGVIFASYYLVFLIGLRITAPGYIERVWNLLDLSGASLFSFPIEEFLFAITFGMFWSSVYEHFTWTQAGTINVQEDKTLLPHR